MIIYLECVEFDEVTSKKQIECKHIFLLLEATIEDTLENSRENIVQPFKEF